MNNARALARLRVLARLRKHQRVALLLRLTRGWRRL